MSKSREAIFSRRIVKGLLSRGIYARKIAENFSSGLPDIYVSGGSWIESKFLPLGVRTMRNPWDALTPLQQETCFQLYESGDNIWIAARYEGQNTWFEVIIPYFIACETKINKEWIYHHFEEKTHVQIAAFFNRSGHRNLANGTIVTSWASWVRDHPPPEGAG